MKLLGAVVFAVTLTAQSAPQADASGEPAPSQVEPDIAPMPTAMPSASVEVRQGEVRAAAIALTDAQRRQERWDKTAAEAIKLLEKGARDLSPSDLAKWEELRAKLAEQRDEALAVSLQGTLPEKIARAQLEALGPAPEADASEDAQTASRREELEERLTLARGPSMAADDAHARAIVLIKEIDRVINSSQRGLVFKQVPSPLLPSSWAALFRDLGTKKIQASEGATVPSNLGDLGEITSGTVMIFGAVLLAFLGGLLASQRAIVRKLDRRVLQQSNAAAAIILTILRDLVVLLLPIGLLIVILVFGTLLDASAPVLSLVFLTVGLAGVVLVFGIWLGQSLLSPEIASQRFIMMSDKRARASYLTVIGLSGVLALEAIYEGFERHFPFSAAATGVVPFILIGATGFLLFRLATLVVGRKNDAIENPEVGAALHAGHSGRRIDFIGIGARAMKVVAIATLLLSALGYDALARMFLSATLETMAIVALAILSFRRTMAIAKVIGGNFARSHEHMSELAPVALGILLIAVSIPLILLAWGLRPAQIGDFISVLRTGVSFGDVRISFGDVVTFSLVFAIGYVLTRWIQRIVEVTVLPRLSLDGGSKSALLTAIGYFGLLLSALIAITSAGLDLSSLAIVFGALSVGIGFGLQNVVANFISGIILLIERPIKKGDWIKVGDAEGIVEKVAVRATHIKAFDRDDVIVPNSELISGIVRNRTLVDTLGRVEIYVGIAYESDVALALQEAMAAVTSHPDVVRDPAPSVTVTEFGESALNLQVFAYIRDVARSNRVRGELHLEIFARFNEAGISIPYPQRNVRVEKA